MEKTRLSNSWVSTQNALGGGLARDIEKSACDQFWGTAASIRLGRPATGPEAGKRRSKEAKLATDDCSIGGNGRPHSFECTGVSLSRQAASSAGDLYPRLPYPEVW